MFEKFTDRARRVMQMADQEARRLNHDRVTAGHILVGLTKEGAGVAANVLKNLGVDLGRARESVERMTPAATGGPIMGRLPLADDTLAAIHGAHEWVAKFGHSYVGTEHLLIGLVSAGGSGAEALAAMGVTAEAVEWETRELLGDLIRDDKDPCVPPYSVGKVTVYTGMWRDDMTHYLDRWPQLKTASEHTLFTMAMRDKAAFDGLWVNCVMILQAFEPNEVVVIVPGREVRMSDDPSLMKQYEVLDTGEVYINTDWEAYK